MNRLVLRCGLASVALLALLAAPSAGAQEVEPAAPEPPAPEVVPADAPAPVVAEPAAPAAATPAAAPRVAVKAPRGARFAPSLAPFPAGDSAVDTPEPEEPSEPWVAPSGAPRIEAWIGLGSTWVTSDSFDAFSDDDALTSVSVGAALRLGSTEGTGVRLNASWDLAGSTESYRGEATSLDVMRFGLGPELEVPVAQRLALNLRGAATAVQSKAELDESSGAATMSDSAWSFGVEGTLGASFRFADLHAKRSPLSFLARAEAGYAWVASHELSLDADGGPRRSAALGLGDLSLGGPVVRVAVGAGF